VHTPIFIHTSLILAVSILNDPSHTVCAAPVTIDSIFLDDLLAIGCEADYITEDCFKVVVQMALHYSPSC
jgi:hypothetical protein